MTSLPAAREMTTLVAGRRPVGLNAQTVGVRAPARVGAMPQAGLPAARAEVQAVQVAQAVAGHSVTTGVRLVQVPAMASGATTGATRGGVTAGRIVAVTGLTGLTGLTGRIGRIGRIVVGTVVLVAGRNVKGSGVARC